ncbi:hypothetical protein G6F57_018076 [Rhizopus arrhizus]|nr:hypothetical protein G6F57_018076 [Rhizopus arrhizus]
MPPVAQQPRRHARQEARVIADVRPVVPRIAPQAAPIAWKRIGYDAGAFDQAGIAITGFLARTAPVQKHHGAATRHQMQRGADPDAARPKNHDVCFHAPDSAPGARVRQACGKRRIQRCTRPLPDFDMPLPLLQPVTLEGDVVRLEPLAIEHADALADVGLHPELWRLQPEPIASADDMRRYVERALAGQRDGACLPFVIVQQSSGQIIGTTRYMDLALAHKRLEIGATWLTPAVQRSGANTEAKFLRS